MGLRASDRMSLADRSLTERDIIGDEWRGGIIMREFSFCSTGSVRANPSVSYVELMDKRFSWRRLRARVGSCRAPWFPVHAGCQASSAMQEPDGEESMEG